MRGSGESSLQFKRTWEFHLQRRHKLRPARDYGGPETCRGFSNHRSNQDTYREVGEHLEAALWFFGMQGIGGLDTRLLQGWEDT